MVGDLGQNETALLTQVNLNFPLQLLHVAVEGLLALSETGDLVAHLVEFVEVLDSELVEDLFALLLDLVPKLGFCIFALLHFDLEQLFEGADLVEHHRVTFSLRVPLFVSFALNLVLDMVVVVLQLLQVRLQKHAVSTCVRGTHHSVAAPAAAA